MEVSGRPGKQPLKLLTVVVVVVVDVEVDVCRAERAKGEGGGQRTAGNMNPRLVTPDRGQDANSERLYVACHTPHRGCCSRSRSRRLRHRQGDGTAVTAWQRIWNKASNA